MMATFPIIPPDPTPEEVEALAAAQALLGDAIDFFATATDLDVDQRRSLNAAARLNEDVKDAVEDMARRQGHPNRAARRRAGRQQ